MTIATIEPTSVRAGDTVQWLRSLPDYSAADSWVLHYRFVGDAQVIDLTATASGADHLVSVLAADSAKWQAGSYQRHVFVTKGAERYTLASGTMQVLPNLATALPGTTLTKAATILRDLETAFANYSANYQGMVREYWIGDRKMEFRTATDFIKLIEYWRGQVAREREADALAAGDANPRRLFVRFGRA